ncbi:hypothetical protein [Patiriisocius marinus]|uniref:Uncharacterized protein n=1 Tax=Patiriisocius marinus TaxID=1397112 RepID=A0A5J4IXH0_9FLAO|nr:hypothetical protein [Patiriisocius marinus]GER58163.1 hypothetical protein ULMA_02710 [Patiriisocius marinus]
MNKLKDITSLVLVFALFTNCSSYKKIKNEPYKMVANKKYHLDLYNGRQMIVLVDSLFANTLYHNKNKEIAIDTIKTIEEATYSKGKTTWLGGVIALGAAITVGIIIAIASWSPSFGG